MKKLIFTIITVFSVSAIACPAKYEIAKNLTRHTNDEFTAAQKEMIKRNYILNSDAPKYTFSFRIIRQNLHYDSEKIRAHVSLDVFDKNGEQISFSARGSKKSFNNVQAIPLPVYEELMVALVDELPVCD